MSTATNPAEPVLSKELLTPNDVAALLAAVDRNCGLAAAT